MGQANEVLQRGIKTVTDLIDEKATLIARDIIEPLELYIHHHDQTSNLQFDQARQFFHDFYEKKTKHTECKRLYMDLC